MRGHRISDNAPLVSKIRDKIANWMRRKADRISPSTAPRSMGAYATFDSKLGWRLHWAGYCAPTSRMPGVPLWYMTNERDRGFTQKGKDS